MKAKPPAVTSQRLRELFEYRDGSLYWKHRHGGKNNRPAGAKAGTPLGKKNHLRVCVDRRFYYVHRLVWMMHYGEPPEMIDHIDGDPLNNRIENLRPVTTSDNMRNSKLNKRNKSGIKGVHRCSKTGKWKGEVYANGQPYRVGPFESLEECGNTVKELRAQLHGEFARHVSIAA